MADGECWRPSVNLYDFKGLKVGPACHFELSQLISILLFFRRHGCSLLRIFAELDSGLAASNVPYQFNVIGHTFDDERFLHQLLDSAQSIRKRILQFQLHLDYRGSLYRSAFRSAFRRSGRSAHRRTKQDSRRADQRNKKHERNNCRRCDSLQFAPFFKKATSEEFKRDFRPKETRISCAAKFSIERAA